MSQSASRLTMEDVSELWECFLGLTAFDYGQLRFGNNEDGTWYDRKKGDNIPASEVIRRGVEQLTETIRLSL